MPVAPAELRWREGGLKGIKVLKSIKVLSIKKKEKEKKDRSKDMWCLICFCAVTCLLNKCVRAGI